MERTLVQVENTSFVRDISSKAILNTDKAGLQKYLADREYAKKQLQEQQEVKSRLFKLEEDMSEIKSLLKLLAQQGMSNGS